MMSIGDKIVCVLDVGSNYLTPGKQYKILAEYRNGDTGKTTQYQIFDDTNRINWFVSSAFCDIREYRSITINEILNG